MIKEILILVNVISAADKMINTTIKIPIVKINLFFMRLPPILYNKDTNKLNKNTVI